MAEIRTARETDIPRILDLYEQLAVSTAPGEPETRPGMDVFQAAFARVKAAPGQDILVAEEAGEVIGTLALVIVPNLSHGGLPWAAVENMVVEGKYRRSGVGRQLIERAIGLAREAGCYKVQLMSTNSRTGAHKFYESAGFANTAKGFRLYL